MYFSAVPMKAAAICALGGIGMGYLIHLDVSRRSDLAEHGLTTVARIEGLRWTTAAGRRTDFNLDVSFLSKDGKANKASIPLRDEAGRKLSDHELPKGVGVQYLPGHSGVVNIVGEPSPDATFNYLLACCILLLAAVLFLWAGFRRNGRFAGVGDLPR